eukprot:Lithocolla_globosa_v1_NODE_3739_length_1594_cov_45.957115.p2 type:complete len:193 gc:universal NODE_3739_length_1594_cov_45.957115:902-324(-)
MRWNVTCWDHSSRQLFLLSSANVVTLSVSGVGWKTTCPRPVTWSLIGRRNVRMIQRRLIGSTHTQRNAPNVMLLLKRMEVAIICPAKTANTTSAGCARVPGLNTGRSGTVAIGMRKRAPPLPAPLRPSHGSNSNAICTTMVASTTTNNRHGWTGICTPRLRRRWRSCRQQRICPGLRYNSFAKQLRLFSSAE